MPRYTRRHLLQMLPCGLIAGAAMGQDGPVYCSPLQNDCIGDPAPDWIYRAWNDPEAEARASERHPAHVAYHGIALSPDGALLVLPTSRFAVNELAIIELTTMRGWRIAHPHSRVMLSQPSFAPDGRLAFVVTPPSYFGIGEVWISTPRADAARVIASAPQRSYKWPTFSWDGRAISYFRDVTPGPLAATRSARREHLGPGLFYALYEFDLAAGTETRIVRQAWRYPQLLYYAANDEDYYVYSEGLMPRLELRADDGAEMWARRTPLGSSRNSAPTSNGYLLARGREPPEVPASVVPDELLNLAADRTRPPDFAAVDRAERLLFTIGSPTGWGSDVVIWDGHDAARALAGHELNIQKPKISADGRTIVGWAADHARRGLAVYFVHFPTGETTSFELDDVRWDDEALVVWPLEHSAFLP